MCVCVFIHINICVCWFDCVCVCVCLFVVWVASVFQKLWGNYLSVLIAMGCALP